MKFCINYCKLLKAGYNQFCLNTSLHGCKFLVEKNSSKFTRCVWFVIISASYIAAYSLIWLSWQNNAENSVETVADSVHYPIWNYRFPAVTICNINKISLNKTKEFIKKLKNPYNFDQKYLFTLLKHVVKLSIDSEYDSNYNNYYNDINYLLNVNNLTIFQMIEQIRPHCKNILQSCALKNRVWRCDSLFEEISTVLGPCCSSNYYALKNRFFSGYLSERYKVKPRRMSACGFQTGYKILIKNHPEDYLFASSPIIGTKVFIHDAYDYPGWSASMEVVAMSEEVFISVIPTLTYATEAIKKLPVQTRMCLFPNEKPLKYFKYYSLINCLMECRADLIQNKCGCLPPFFWNLNLNKNDTFTKPCNITTAKCIASYTDTLVSSLPGFKYDGNERFNYKEAEKQSFCKCLPACEISEYTIETSKTIFSKINGGNYNQFFDRFNLDNHSVINIYFKDLISNRHKKDVNMSWYSELAWFGGYLGLFVGFSFTSGYEILYYISIRFLIDSYLFKKQKCNNISTKNNPTKISPIYYIDNIKVQSFVPPLKQLYRLKRTNNNWFIE